MNLSKTPGSVETWRKFLLGILLIAHSLQPWVWKESPCYPRAQDKGWIWSLAAGLPLRRHHCSLTLFMEGFSSDGPASADLVDSAIRFSAILKLASHIYGYFREIKNNVSCYSFNTFIEETTDTDRL